LLPPFGIPHLEHLLLLILEDLALTSPQWAPMVVALSVTPVWLPEMAVLAMVPHQVAPMAVALVVGCALLWLHCL